MQDANVLWQQPIQVGLYPLPCKVEQFLNLLNFIAHVYCIYEFSSIILSFADTITINCTFDDFCKKSRLQQYFE